MQTPILPSDSDERFEHIDDCLRIKFDFVEGLLKKKERKR